MYLIESPRFISTADSLNTTVKDREIEEGSAVYHPLNTLHRQYKPETSDRANFWIHAGYLRGAGSADVFDLLEVATWRRPR